MHKVLVRSNIPKLIIRTGRITSTTKIIAVDIGLNIGDVTDVPPRLLLFSNDTEREF